MYPSASHTPSPPAAPPPVQPPPSTTTRIPTSSTAPPSTDIHFSTGQPVFNIQQDTSHVPAKWSTGLCDCSDDLGNCCLTCLCPCVTFGRIAEVVDGGTTSCWASGGLYALIMCLTGWPCLYSCFYRSKLRGQHFLEETPCSDCLVHCCFEYCALCQEHRELNNRGLDPRNGWQGPIVPVAPVVEGRMTR